MEIRCDELPQTWLYVDPEHCQGIHVNYMAVAQRPKMPNSTGLSHNGLEKVKVEPVGLRRGYSNTSTRLSHTSWSLVCLIPVGLLAGGGGENFFELGMDCLRPNRVVVHEDELLQCIDLLGH